MSDYENNESCISYPKHMSNNSCVSIFILIMVIVLINNLRGKMLQNEVSC